MIVLGSELAINVLIYDPDNVLWWESQEHYALSFN